MTFKDKVILITGASSGIGAATAFEFAKQLAKITIVGRNEEKLRTTAEACKKQHNIEPQIIVADLSQEDEAKSIVDKTVKHWGKLDVLINNAGKGGKDFVSDENFVDSYDDIMATNVRSVIILTNAAVPHLTRTKGNIVNISSVAALRSLPGSVAYCVSKAALDQFTKSAAQELASKGIRVNSINPGPVKTNFFGTMGFTQAQADKSFDHFDKIMPLGKVAESNEVADMIVYLASDKARSVTGSVFVIDCGALLISYQLGSNN